ncbi:DUF6544 family protein [Gordonia sp. 'Campus']|uniref:DUF6544 family protein n=1 Tax=Gordonia sp. 'Campus' TaxID=2915824 RepID=UPI001EE4329A|nr:DUF6544 family protein [Gordonia sp. 'Campus']
MAFFDPELCAELPAPARRWLCASLATGTPLARRVRITMTGSINLRAWRPFRAEQLIVPGHGFIWAARTRVGGLPVSGFDRFTGTEGEMRWKMAGLIRRHHDPDALGRTMGRTLRCREFGVLPRRRRAC